MTSFSDTDSNLLKLFQTELDLKAKIELISKQIGGLSCDLNEALKLKNRDRAKQLLRRRKMREKEMTRLMNLEDSVIELKSSIENAFTDKEVLNALNDGSKALKTVLGDTTLSNAEDILDELKESIADSRELSDIIGESGKSEDDFDLEKELEDLVKEDKGADKNDDLVASLAGMKVVGDNPVEVGAKKKKIEALSDN